MVQHQGKLFRWAKIASKHSTNRDAPTSNRNTEVMEGTPAVI